MRYSERGAGVNHVDASMCQCLAQLEHSCQQMVLDKNRLNLSGHHRVGEFSKKVDYYEYDSEMGRLCYTVAILLMFAGIIILLMVRSIRRSKAAVEMEGLLEAMRFREELDLHQRQKRRLQKAKSKVSAWLSKTNSKLWSSTPQFNTASMLGARTNSLQSSSSFIPEIVISDSDGGGGLRNRPRQYTPSLSLIYDFECASRKGSMISNVSVRGSVPVVSNSEEFLDEAELRAARQRSASRAPSCVGSECSLKSASPGPSGLLDLQTPRSSTSSLSPAYCHTLTRGCKIDIPS
uniref:Uncharacterized protein n=1 Tax=Panagrellus redivivus TaxID=6233 RepID=A0A7E4VYU8_PANRE